ncbi:P-loop containing nucleoside triphosphate hydrolase protein [Apiospora marii]|uniref:P-loop containing nucleoside triphosphate hydrolase protein n=1 Tax=Apiospora marii TaxID=335849 RepID=UPI003130775F
MTASYETARVTDSALLETIDKVRELNINQHVPLTQLVVVGDQSSGKSSLLETATGLPMEHDVELCTRFATQITSRRDPESRVTVTIIPGPDASDEHKKRLGDFTFDSLTIENFRRQLPNIFRQANVAMGIRTDTTSSDGKIFSKDVLKIEKRGPNEDYLTVIDVPGIFRNINEGVTTTEDIELVRDMVKQYIQDSRTIILAVLAGNVHIDNQEILTLALQYDPTGERTLGVLTKPDLVTETSEKQRVCDLVLGKKKPLTLGYYVVKNRGPDETEERWRADKTLQMAPWNGLPKERVGPSALRTRLRELSEQLTRREFPKIRKQVKTELEATKRQIDDMGQSRQGERDQRLYLGAITRRFQDMAKAALNGWYSDEAVFEKVNMRLITHIVNLSDDFYDGFTRSSHLHKFQNEGEDTKLTCQKSLDLKLRDAGCKTVRGLFDCIDLASYPELEGIVCIDDALKDPDEDAHGWIYDMYLQSRNMDLGTFGGNVFSIAFREQSTKWGQMTKSYMSKAILLVHLFITDALNIACPDTQVKEMLWSEIIDQILARYTEAMDQAMLLVQIERQKRPYTLSKEFSQRLQLAQGCRTAALLKTIGRSCSKGSSWSSDDQSITVDPDVVGAASVNQSNIRRTTQEIHDKLRAYYDLALCRFVDNVFQQSVDYCLLTGPSTPLAVLDQNWVIQLEAKKFRAIAGESKASESRRGILEGKARDLAAAMDILM